MLRARLSLIASLSLPLVACGALTGIPLDTTDTADGTHSPDASTSTPDSGGHLGTPDASGGVTFAVPLQTYTGCTSNTYTTSSSGTSAAGGSGTMTLSETGGVVTAAVDGSLLGIATSLTFDPVDATSATARSGQSFSPDSLQSNGTGNPAVPVTMGAISWVGETVFLSVYSTATGSAGFVSCVAPTAAAPVPVAAASILPGPYTSCTLTLDIAGSGITGPAGVVFLVLDGTSVEASFETDDILMGAVFFDIDSSETGTLVSGAGLTADTFPCDSGGMGLPTPGIQPLTSPAGKLVATEDGLVINLTATTGTCPATVSIACSPSGG